MTKMGCNPGACHGALAGKNGFKLTLRGYDPDVDYDTLTRQAVGRRVSLAEPAASLILPSRRSPSRTAAASASIRHPSNTASSRNGSRPARRPRPPRMSEIRGLEVFPPPPC